jgi:hypothetical protein
MKFSSATVVAASLGMASASPSARGRRFNIREAGVPSIHKRQVPQEHSHDIVLEITRNLLNLNNPKSIGDPVFGLLGNAAAAEGAGDVTNLDCLKQETADQAFTNAKEIQDIGGMAMALLFQAIERNTAGVGVESVLCTELAVNPEIAALTQHQDAAADGAQALNKAITLELARQLAAIGADPNLALLSGTFAPGDVNDATGAGNSCDDLEPELGCIFSQGLLVLDASQEEIADAVKDVAQTFTGTNGFIASELVDLDSFSTQSVTDVVDLATVVNGAAGGAVPTPDATATETAEETATETPEETATETPEETATETPEETAVETTAEETAAKETETVTVTVTPEECNLAAAPTPTASASDCTVVTTTLLGGAQPTLVTSIQPRPTEDAAQDEQEQGEQEQDEQEQDEQEQDEPTAVSGNLQTFAGDLGGPAPPVQSGAGDRPFEVNGAAFPALENALVRSCDIQNNQCFNAVNSGELDAETSECQAQLTECQDAARSGAARRMPTSFSTTSLISTFPSSAVPSSSSAMA